MDELSATNQDEYYQQYHASAITSRENSHDDEGFEDSFFNQIYRGHPPSAQPCSPTVGSRKSFSGLSGKLQPKDDMHYTRPLGSAMYTGGQSVSTGEEFEEPSITRNSRSNSMSNLPSKSLYPTPENHTTVFSSQVAQVPQPANTSMTAQQSQQQVQMMLALGQAQYVMIPGVGLALVPIVHMPSNNITGIPTPSVMQSGMQPSISSFQQFGMTPSANPMMYPTGLPGLSGTPSIPGLSTANGGTRTVFKNTVLTLATMAMASADGLVYLVQFKHTQRNLILSPMAPRGITIGEFVIVEADRGEDIGIVVEIAPASLFDKDKHTAGHRWKGFATGQNGEIRKVLRVASIDERVLLSDKAEEEAAVAEACREKVLYQFKIPITIVDTEFQVDRHKLTIYYETQRRIDFRELVRELFSLYKTRIWMAQVDLTFEPNLEAAACLQSGNYPSFAKFDPNDTSKIYDIGAYVLESQARYHNENSSNHGYQDDMVSSWPSFENGYH